MVDQAAVEALVREGRLDDALTALRPLHFSDAQKILDPLRIEAGSPNLRSSYRHLLSAVMFENGDQFAQLKSYAVWMLHRDLDDPETPEEFKALARTKIQSAVDYSPRLYKQGDDMGEMLKARRNQQSVTIRSDQPEKEVSMLKRAFGDVELVDDMDWLTRKNMFGMDGTQGSLMRAAREGKVLVMISGEKCDVDVAGRIDQLLQDGELEDYEGNIHHPAPGFMMVVVLRAREQRSYDTDLEFMFG